MSNKKKGSFCCVIQLLTLYFQQDNIVNLRKGKNCLVANIPLLSMLQAKCVQPYRIDLHDKERFSLFCNIECAGP